MSIEAYRIPEGMNVNDDNVLDIKNQVDADDLTQEDRGSLFRCAGCKVKGLKCYAVMRPVFPTGPKRMPYFRTDKRYGGHASDCPHDKKSKVKVVMCKNRTGKGVDVDILINMFTRSYRRANIEPAPGLGIDQMLFGEAVVSPEEAAETKPITNRKHNPRKLIELLYLLIKSQREGIKNYAGIPISHWLINKDTINHFRNQAEGTGEWQIAILRRTKAGENIRESKREFVLRDAYSKKAEDDVYFVLRFKNANTAHYVKEKISDAQNDDLIAVIAKWERRDKDGKRVWWVSADTLLDGAWVAIVNKKRYDI